MSEWDIMEPTDGEFTFNLTEFLQHRSRISPLDELIWFWNGKMKLTRLKWSRWKWTTWWFIFVWLRNLDGKSASRSRLIFLVHIISDQSTLKQCLLCWLVCQCVNTGETHFCDFLLFLCLLLILFLAHLSLIFLQA